MLVLPLRMQVIVKVLLAVVLLSVLAAVAGSQLAPTVALHQILLCSAIGVAALLALITLVVVVMFAVSQWILRQGGVDTQWLWFSAASLGFSCVRAKIYSEDFYS